MRDFLMDLIMAGLVLFLFHGLFGSNVLVEDQMQKQLQTFEEAINNQEVIIETSHEEVIEDNVFSKCLLTISQCCVTIIQTFVLLISRFISKLL